MITREFLESKGWVLKEATSKSMTFFKGYTPSPNAWLTYDYEGYLDICSVLYDSDDQPELNIKFDGKSSTIEEYEWIINRIEL